MKVPYLKQFTKPTFQQKLRDLSRKIYLSDRQSLVVHEELKKFLQDPCGSSLYSMILNSILSEAWRNQSTIAGEKDNSSYMTIIVL